MIPSGATIRSQGFAVQLWEKKWSTDLVDEVVTFATNLREQRRKIKAGDGVPPGGGASVPPGGGDGVLPADPDGVLDNIEKAIADSLPQLIVLLGDTVVAVQSIATALHTARALGPDRLDRRAHCVAVAALLDLGVGLNENGDSVKSVVASSPDYAGPEFTEALCSFTPFVSPNGLLGCRNCYRVIEPGV